MRRATIGFTLILSTLLLGLGTPAMAFTLRLAPIDHAHSLSDFPRNSQAALPMPTFLRFAVSRRTATMALEKAYVRRDFSTPQPRLVLIPFPPPVSRQTETALPRDVSGVETQLLRDTQSVVSKPQR